MASLLTKIRFNLTYFSFWLGYFIIARILFLTYYYNQSVELNINTILNTFIYGIRLDLSFAAYISAIPFLFLILSLWLKNQYYLYFVKLYSYLIIISLSFLMIVDLGLYEAWGIRLDSSPLIYINTPKEMLASLTFKDLLLATGLFNTISIISIIAFNKSLKYFKHHPFKGSFWQIPIILLTTGFLVLVMRGGLQTIPLNQSNVYFSNTMFANHAAINYAWNFTHSLSTESYNTENPFEKYDFEQATEIFKKAQAPCIETSNSLPVLNTSQPNILIIIWESLTAKVVEPLGGKKGVTENFNQLCKEGLLFSNFYANGNRSDKGLVSILSGYYPQPHKSIIKNPSKSRSLPILSKTLNRNNYHSSFYYGGDLNFGNMNTYLRNGDIHTLIDGNSFKKEDWNSKWGVHDHIVFNKLFENLNVESTPFFSTFFTLSSHEPFEFPDEYKFGKKGKTNKFLSSLAYTDQALGDFISKAKKEVWWDNTLIIILADHGHSLPKQKGLFNQASRFHIPMLWLGGALSKKGVCNTYASQTDLAYSLLNQLNLPTEEYPWGKDIFNENHSGFAHYIFNKGFGIIDSTSLSIFDYTNDKVLLEVNDSNSKLDSLGKAISQITYQDYILR